MKNYKTIANWIRLGLTILLVIILMVVIKWR